MTALYRASIASRGKNESRPLKYEFINRPNNNNLRFLYGGPLYNHTLLPRRDNAV